MKKNQEKEEARGDFPQKKMRKFTKQMKRLVLLTLFIAFWVFPSALEADAAPYRDYTGIYDDLEANFSLDTQMMHSIMAEPWDDGSYTGIVGYGYKFTTGNSDGYYSCLFQNRNVNGTINFYVIQLNKGVEEVYYTTTAGMSKSATANLNLTANTTYYILAFTDNIANVSGDSYVTVSAINDDCGNEYTTAKSIEFNRDYQGSIDSEGDVDYYSFQVPGSSSDYGHFYAITVGNDSVTSRLQANLYDSDLKSVSGYQTASLTMGLQAKRIVNLTPGETYYLAIAASSSAVNNGTYQIQIIQINDDITDGYKNASLIKTGDTSTGVIQAGSDKDIFRINTGNLTALNITLSNTGSDSSSVVCKITNSSGRVFAQGSAKGSNYNVIKVSKLSTYTDYYVVLTGTEGTSYSITPSEITYTIKYVLNGGKNASFNPNSYVYGIGTTISNPTRTNFEFQGWYKNTLFLGSKVTEISSSDSGNYTLYAKWKKKNVYDITSFRATKVSSNSLTLKWSKVKNADGYIVYRGSKKIATTKKTSCKVTGLKSCKKYTFKVRAYRTFDSGNTYGGYAKLTQYTAPAKVTINYTKGDTVSFLKGQISVSWNSVSKASGYEICTSQFKKGTYKKRAIVDKKTKCYTIKNLLKKGYWVKVRAFRKVNGETIYGAYSTPVKVYARTQK